MLPALPQKNIDFPLRSAMMERVRYTSKKLPGLCIECKTHVGLLRSRNEDAAAIEVTEHGLVMVICDGMGGHKGGDRASTIAADVFIETIQNSSEPFSYESALYDAVANANQAILETGERDPELRGMGTTMVGAVIQNQVAYIVNIGDSRAYHYDTDGKLMRISTDHSLVQELVRQGELTEKEAALHPHRNVITRVLGTRKNIQPDYFSIPLAQGDMLVLATDGLHGYVEDEIISAALSSVETPGAMCEMLVQASLNVGGADNITVAIALAEQ